MKLLLFLISVFFFNSAICQQQVLLDFDPEKTYTQTYIDSMINAPAFPMRISQFKKVLESDKSLYGWQYHDRSMAISHYNKRQYDSVIYFAKKGYEAFERSKVKRQLDGEYAVACLYYNAKVHSESNQRDYNEAVKIYHKALELEKKYPFRWKSFILASLGSTHGKTGNDSLALKYNILAMEDSAYSALPRPAAIAYTRIGNLYEKFANESEAIRYYHKGVKVSNNSDYKFVLAPLYGCLGNIYHDNKIMDSAYYYYQKAHLANQAYGNDNFPGSKDYDTYYKSYINIHGNEPAKNIKDLKKLILATNEAEIITKDSKELMQDAVNLLGLAYQKTENYKEYSNLLNTTFSILDEFHADQLREDLTQLEIQYQTKEKDASIAQLEENRQQQEKIISQQRTIAFGLGGLLLLLSGLGYLFWRQRKLKNQYEKENLEQRLLRSQMNPHFVSNALNTVCALVDKKSDQTIPYVNKLAGLFRLTLNNSREEFVSLDEELAALRNYLELQSNLSQDFDFRIHVDEHIDVDDTIVPPMLMQPFVENAIIHGLTGSKDRGEVQIKISMDKTNRLLQCNISDNGIGYGNASVELKKHKSVSGDIVSERLAILKKKFKVNTRFNIVPNKNAGTRVELYMPYLID